MKDKKSKKVAFSQESKKKTPKDPSDLKGLQKILKTMSNDMIEIKKHHPYNRSPAQPSQPPNVISSAEPDQDVEDASVTK